jgi:hypothetical protein
LLRERALTVNEGATLSTPFSRCPASQLPCQRGLDKHSSAAVRAIWANNSDCSEAIGFADIA